ncbi:MAG: DUF561 domain-containing protein [bacterium]
MNRAITNLRESLNERTCVKVIAGIDNFDAEKVRKVVIAAERGGANAVDIAASVELIEMVKEITTLPVFVSSICPEELAMAVNAGADALEVGNYDALYKNGERVTAAQVLEITRKTRELVGNDVFLSVTVPGHISVEEQIVLAQSLEEMKIDLIQTEGAATVDAKSAGARGLLETAQVSIANTIELVRNVEVPVMTASGIGVTTAPMALAAGASAVGIGSSVNKLNSQIEMIASVMSIVEAVRESRNVKSKELV